MIHIDFVEEAGTWPSLVDIRSLVEPAIYCSISTAQLSVPEHAEMAFIFTDDARIQGLNRQWRQQDKPTNVLSFASNTTKDLKSPLLGDVVLAFETIERETEEQGKRFNDHLIHLSVHGFLHLVGYDHKEDTQAVEMERLEANILNQCGIADPYASIAN